MAVLPYLTVSVIATIGGFSTGQLRRFGTRLAAVIAGVWTVTLTFAFLLPLMLPPIHSGAFFSSTLIEPPPRLDVVDLYIPANPFFALANNIVPAVVVFSSVVGAALIVHPRKQLLLEGLTAWAETLGIVMRRVTALTPYGVFAIVAHTAGTLRFDEASRLEVYLLGYGALALLVALWVLPALVSVLTAIPVRAIFASTREALLTAAIAGDLFIVLPLLVDATKDLVVRHGPARGDAATLPEAIVPVAYNFPHSGKLLTLSFILFAGWFSDAPLDLREYPSLAMVGVFSLFGSVNVAIPFLLDVFRVPADTFQLYVAVGVINSRFGSLVAAMHTVVVALLGTFAVAGALRWRAIPVATFAAVTTALTVIVIGGTHLAAAALLRDPPASADVLDRMQVDRLAPEGRLADAAAIEDRPPAGSRLDAISASRTLRVGVLADALPFAFVNAAGELVGLDVALAHHLARELGVGLQFVRVARTHLNHESGAAALLGRGRCDILVGGMTVTTSRARVMQLSESYLSETLAFVVRDDQRRHFDTWPAIRANHELTIAVPAAAAYEDLLRRRLPRARLITVATSEELFRIADRIDAIVMPGERGSAWTLRYPQLTVVVPEQDVIRVPLAYGLPDGEPELTEYVNTWIDLKRSDGTIQSLYDYWILGRTAAAASPRWSIIRDVLNWVR